MPTPSPSTFDPAASGGDFDLALGVAALALVVSVVTFVIGLVEARKGRKIALYLDLETRLTDLESQSGRRALHALLPAHDPEDIYADSPDDYDRINRVLSLYNTLGSYVSLNYVEGKVVQLHWGPTIRDSWTRLEIWVRHRQAQTGDPLKFASVVWLGREFGASVSDDLLNPAGTRPPASQGPNAI